MECGFNSCLFMVESVVLRRASRRITVPTTWTLTADPCLSRDNRPARSAYGKLFAMND
jgi:hypothetical protein